MKNPVAIVAVVVVATIVFVVVYQATTGKNLFSGFSGGNGAAPSAATPTE